MFVPNLRHAWRWWSVRVSAVGAIAMGFALAAPETLLAAWNMLPAELRALVPDHVATKIALGLFIASGAARVLKQREADNGR